MSLRVMKFGGSSVGRPERLARIMVTIDEARREGPLAVVCSAFGDSTDRLLEAARGAMAGDPVAVRAAVARVQEEAELALGGASRALGVDDPFAETVPPLLARLEATLAHPPRGRGEEGGFLDEVASFGERIACRSIASLLRSTGLPAFAVDARELVVTDDRFTDARVQGEPTRRRLRGVAAEWEGRVPVITGFLGRTRDGRTTTLGRNGSDYTAALVASALGARDLTVWTDVTGVMTADPARVPDAYPVRHISYAEALDLAHMGLRMFHPRSMATLAEAGVALTIRHTMRPDDPGTRIDQEGSPDLHRPTSVISQEGLALVEVEADAQEAALADRALALLRAAGVTPRVGVHELGGGVSLLVRGEDGARTVELLAGGLRAEGAVVRLRRPVTLVTLLAEAMGRGANVAGRLFRAVGGVGVNVRAIAMAANSRSIAFVVDDADTALAVRTAHDAFNFTHTEVNLLVVGKGTVGSALLDQLHAQGETLRREHGLLLKVSGLADRQRLRLDPRGIDTARWREALDETAPLPAPPDVAGLLADFGRLPVPVLVDVTAQDGNEVLYREAFARGMHVVAANKKPLAIAQEARDALLQAAVRHHRRYHYETTVGASLPVVGTLKDLVRTGDRVRRVEGSFSGTLGFLCGELMHGVPLSQAVRAARGAGYTEPHPRDDLTGLDAARKALILAREIGCRLSLEDVRLEPLVPREHLSEDDPERFIEALRTLDDATSHRVARLREEGKVLRYLARIDPAAARDAILSVGPVEVPLDHPAARLRGAEAFVSFTTDRHHAYPLLVQGAGAGGAVTASGVLADILSIAQAARTG
jgi:aspartokinase/homoserine dehydrogenase 1